MVITYGPGEPVEPEGAVVYLEHTTLDRKTRRVDTTQRERVEKHEREAIGGALDGMDMFNAELLETVSHELYSPLASIKGYAATLLRHEHRLEREEQHQFLLAISEASNRMEIIIERLLEVSQFETGQVTLACSPVDLARLTSEAIAVVKDRMTASQSSRFAFSLELEHADGTRAENVPLIMADPRRLREVLDNLLENACKYSPDGGSILVTIRPVIQVSAPAEAGNSSHEGEEVAPNGSPKTRSMLEFCVVDSGQGIPAEYLERIFERFRRVDTRLVRETGGLGLGLTICKDIVDLHGGTIWAENRAAGKGSAFYVWLPLDAADADLL
jgi:signal transduction histidine kinase